MKQCNILITKVQGLVGKMISLADKGYAAASDDCCRSLFSVLQDCAYRIRMEADREKKAHIRAGKWESEDRGPRDRGQGSGVRG